MYQVMRSRLKGLGVNVVETTFNDSKSKLGSCTLSRNIPTIYVEKGLDTANKTSVLLHELIHASSYWTKRKWWVQYVRTYNKKYYYMEESLAHYHLKTWASFTGIEDTYCSKLSREIFDRYSARIASVDLREVQEENILVGRWLSNNFGGINNEFDRYINEIAVSPSFDTDRLNAFR